jgi:hypothetical protein
MTLAFAVTFVIPVKADDLWWHLAAGAQVLQTGSIPHTNLFSFSAPDAPWLAHEWLSEVLFALVYRLGAPALTLLALLLQVLAFLCVAHFASGSGKTPVLSAGVTFVLGLLLLANFSLRPYLLGNLGLLAALYLVENPAWPGRGRWLVIVALFAAWANLHGSFLFGLGVFGLWAPRRRRWGELGLALLGSLATPNHVHGLVFPVTYAVTAFKTSRTFLSEIMEWQPVQAGSPLGVVLLVVCVAAVLVVIVSKVRPSFEHAVLVLVFGAAAFSAIRNVPLLGVALAVALPKHLEGLSSRAAALAEVEQRASAVLPLGLWFAVALVWGTRLPLVAASPGAYPAGLLRFLEHRPERRIFNFYNWGGALMFTGHPVFIDQRNDCYPPEVFADFFTVYRLAPGWGEVLRRWAVDGVAWPAGSRVTEALEASPEWSRDYADDQSVFFSRRVAP